MGSGMPRATRRGATPGRGRGARDPQAPGRTAREGGRHKHCRGDAVGAPGMTVRQGGKGLAAVVHRHHHHRPVATQLGIARDRGT